MRIDHAHRAYGTRCPAALVALAALALAAPATLAEPEERWYVVTLEGERSGWMKETVETAPDGDIRTTTEMTFKLARMGQEIELSVLLGFLETAEGEPVSALSKQEMGVAGSTTIRYRFRDDDVEVRTRTAFGGESTTIAPVPDGQWLTPAETARYVEARLEAGADVIEHAAIDWSNGLQTHLVRYEVEADDTTVEAMGKTVPAIRWTTTTSLMPGLTSESWVDNAGRPIRTDLLLGGMTFTILAADKELALSPFDGPELMAATLVAPDKPIERPRDVSRAVFRLTANNGSLPEFPSAGAQRFDRIGDGRATVTIDLADPLPAPAADLNDARYREPSRMIESDDPAIIALTERALAGLNNADDLERARAIERFVVGYIEDKTLGVGFASAAEVCATREGDCSEHAVLLAAMLRAAGIPSRTVSGLVYVDQFVGSRQVFGFHMWTQALIETDGRHRWVDLDAAVYPMDATHVAVSTSSLADGDVTNSMVAVAAVMGNLSIEVVETVR